MYSWYLSDEPLFAPTELHKLHHLLLQKHQVTLAVNSSQVGDSGQSTGASEQLVISHRYTTLFNHTATKLRASNYCHHRYTNILVQVSRSYYYFY